MGYTYQFMDNTSYSAADVNKIFSKLTTQGVSLFNDTGNPLMDLNEAINNFVTPGVELYNVNACKVVLVNGAYKISQGTAFMHDGASITFDDDGHEIEVTAGVVNYVYLESNTSHNSVDIVVSEIQGGANSVPLATIAANGTITDTRVFAKSRVLAATVSISRKKTVTLALPSAGDQEIIDMEWVGFSKLWTHPTTQPRGELNDISETEIQISFGAANLDYVMVKKQSSTLVFRNNGPHGGTATLEIEVM